MGEQKLYQASANWLKSAVDALCAAGIEVLAPTQSESGKVDLARVTSSEQVIQSYGNTAFPLKRLFLPMTEVLLEFEACMVNRANEQQSQLRRRWPRFQLASSTISKQWQVEQR